MLVDRQTNEPCFVCSYLLSIIWPVDGGQSRPCLGLTVYRTRVNDLVNQALICEVADDGINGLLEKFHVVQVAEELASVSDSVSSTHDSFAPQHRAYQC